MSPNLTPQAKKSEFMSHKLALKAVDFVKQP